MNTVGAWIGAERGGQAACISTEQKVSRWSSSPALSLNPSKQSVVEVFGRRTPCGGGGGGSGGKYENSLKWAPVLLAPIVLLQNIFQK